MPEIQYAVPKLVDIISLTSDFTITDTVTTITDGTTPWEIPIAANESWIFNAMVCFAVSSSSLDCKMNVTAPSGATGRYSAMTSAIDRSPAIGTESLVIALGSGNPSDEWIHVMGLVRNSTTAGDISIQIANNSSGSGQSLGEDSFVTFSRFK